MIVKRCSIDALSAVRAVEGFGDSIVPSASADRFLAGHSVTKGIALAWERVLRPEGIDRQGGDISP